MTANSPLTTRWRFLYSIALVTMLITSGYGNSGWVSLALGGSQQRIAGTGFIIGIFALCRLIWIWKDLEHLTWPATPRLHTFAKVCLVLAVVGVLGLIARIVSGFYALSLASDVRGAFGLVIGLALLPVIGLASLGFVAFEWARGWSLRTQIPSKDRILLTTAAITGVLLATTLLIDRTIFRSVYTYRFHGVLLWIVLSVGIGASILSALRLRRMPASAVFATCLSGYVGAALVLTVVTALQSALTSQSSMALLSGGPFMFSIVVGLQTLVGTGAVLAVTLAGIPLLAVALTNRGSDPTAERTALARGIAAAGFGLIVALSGVLIGTSALKPVPKGLREPVMSDERLADQTRFLERRCAQAGTQVFRVVRDVTQLEIRFPDPWPPDPNQNMQIYIIPEVSRPHDWFVPRTTFYETVVLAFGAERRGYGINSAGAFGYGDVDAKNLFPRYFLTWRRLESPAEAARGIAGIELTIGDSETKDLIAKQTLFFKQTKGYGPLFREACGTLASDMILDHYAYQWVSKILVPKPKQI